VAGALGDDSHAIVKTRKYPYFYCYHYSMSQRLYTKAANSSSKGTPLPEGFLFPCPVFVGAGLLSKSKITKSCWSRRLPCELTFFVMWHGGTFMFSLGCIQAMK
jgi:hypothetical protein